MRAATPVLDRTRTALAGVRAGGLLTDGNGVVLDRYFGSREFEEVSANLGGGVGMPFDEPHTGTNAIATVVETREPVTVLSQEHYLECLQRFDCYGVPIFNPVTRRFEGVIDIIVDAGSTDHWSALRLLLDQLLRDIETRLMSDYDYDLQRSVAAFQALTQRTRDAAMLFGADFVLQNRRAQQEFSATDVALLQKVADSARRDQTVSVTLESGRDVTVQMSGTDSSRRHTLLRVRSDACARISVPRAAGEASTVTERLDRRIAALTAATANTVIVGEPGTGRTYTAGLIAGRDALILDAATTEREVLTEMRSHRGNAVIDGLEAASPELLVAIAGMLTAATDVRVILTCSATAGNDTAYVVSLCPERLDLPPLRERLGDVPRIADRMLATACAPDGRVLRLTSAVHDLLQQHLWPGNVAELSVLVGEVAKRRSTGDIAICDLPKRYQRPSTPRRGLTALEQAEWSIIHDTLTRCDWNKSHAAKQLGISRSKLYARMRYFSID